MTVRSSRSLALSLMVVALGIVSALPSPLLAQDQFVSLDSRTPRFLLAAKPAATPLDVEKTAVLTQRIALALRDVTVEEALQAISRESGLNLAYSGVVVRLDRRVRLVAEEITVAAALSAVLLDADTDVLFSGGTQATLVRRAGTPKATVPAARRAPVADSVTVSGRVADSTTNEPLPGVLVSIEGTDRRQLTGVTGTFTLRNVPPGSRVLLVRRLGYRVARRELALVADRDTSVVVALVAVPTTLTQVVTTGAGDRMYLEVGNSIDVIHADSIVLTTPLRNLSDLLRGRSEGTQVLSNSGTVGAGSRIRIRGPGSLLMSSDPIVIVDGVRLDAAYSKLMHEPATVVPNLQRSPAQNRVAETVPATSRLDDIDPETIESIEILKGPAAATLYGSDAANGVIVIRTKRGSAGPTRWNFFGQEGTSRMKASFMDAWRGWGENIATQGRTECRLSDVASGVCTQDSVTRYNPLNHAETSPLARGSTSRYGAQVSGGTQQLQYFVGGNYADEVGLLRLPPFDEQELLRARNGRALPPWIVRPNVMQTGHLSNKLTAQLGPKADLSMSFSITHRDHRDAPVSAGTYVAEGATSLGFRDPIGLGWGSSSPGDNFLRLAGDKINRGHGGLTGSWRPTTYFTARATVGADYTMRGDETLLRANERPGVASTSFHIRNDSKTLVRTMDLGASLELPVLRGLRSRTSVGGQYTGQDYEAVLASGFGLSPGGEVISDGTTFDADEITSASAVAGWYLQQTAILNQRLFVTMAVRGDAGSAFGRNAKTVLYPKWNASWLLSDEPFFPRLPAVNAIRLRTAYGHAGVQPTVDARFRSHRSANGFINGVIVPGILVNTLGNPNLLPERSTELEGGFDIGLFNDRLTLDATMYHRFTEDAIVTRTLPPSFGLTTRAENVGEVENRGVELSASVRPLSRDMVSWDFRLGFARNTNELISLKDANMPQPGGTNRYVPGYPINGFWTRALLGYNDVNGNGIIERNEIRLTDSAIYVGQPYPKGTFSWHNTLAFLSGLISVNTSFNYAHGMTQHNNALRSQCFAGRCRGINDPTVGLEQQAIAVLNNIITESYGGMENVSWLRWETASVSLAMPTWLSNQVRARSGTVSFAGRNLGMWSRYSGADPEVNTLNVGSSLGDVGGIPQTRDWSIRVNLGY